MRYPTIKGTISWDPEGGTSFTKIAQVKDIGGPNISREDLETTDRDSAALPYRDYLPGLVDGGEVTFDLNFDPEETTHDQATGILKNLTLAVGDDAIAAFLVEVPLREHFDAQWAFDAYVKNVNQDLPLNGLWTADITVKITGAPVLGIEDSTP